MSFGADPKPLYVDAGQIWENRDLDDEDRRVVVKGVWLHAQGYWWIETLNMIGAPGRHMYANFRLNYHRVYV